MNCQDLREKNCLDELAERYSDSDKARILLGKLGFNRRDIPSFNGTANEFWGSICDEIEGGKIEGGIQSLIATVLESYPYNPIFNECINAFSSTSQSNSDISNNQSFRVPSEPCMIVAVTGVDDPLVLLERAQQLAQNIGITGVTFVLTRGDATVLQLIDATDRQAEALRQHLEGAFSDQNIQAQFARENFIDYLLSSLTLVGPNQTRFEVLDIPASTPIKNLADPIQDAKDDTGDSIWPENKLPVFNRILGDGSIDRLDAEISLHENGLRDGDVLQVAPENTGEAHDSTIPTLYVEGPDNARFELNDIPVSTTIKDIAHVTISQYEEEFWPTDDNALPRPAVVDRITVDGSGKRLNPDETLEASNIKDGDTLQVFPERTAGSVNPLIREEALVRVRKQILAYAKTHKSFLVSANAKHVPTEYLFTFQASGFGCPDSSDKEPYQLNQHKVFVFLSADFPMKAPVVHWQSPVIFHPNVHPENGEVCLGVLQEKYTPGMDFSQLCQILVDFASYQNYEIRDAYNEKAVEWVKSDIGQQAIKERGGRTIEDWFINLVEQKGQRPIFGMKRI